MVVHSKLNNVLTRKFASLFIFLFGLIWKIVRNNYLNNIRDALIATFVPKLLFHRKINVLRFG